MTPINKLVVMMHMIENLSVVLFVLLFAAPVSAQENSIAVKFENLDLLDVGWKGKRFYFKINETHLSPDNEIHKVAINPDSLDLIYFSFDSTFNNSQPVLTKFRTGHNYTIRINPCSQYELIADNSSMMGQVRFKVINTDSTYFGGLCASDSLEKDKPSLYYAPCQSVMCQFAPVEISFSANQKMVDIVLFHFLHGEKITAVFDAKKNAIQILIDEN